MSQIKIAFPAVVYSFLGLFIMSVADNIRGPVFSEILKSFNLTHTEGSYYFAAASFGSFVFGYLAQRPLRRWGAIRTHQIGIFSLFVSQFIMYWSPVFEGMILGGFLLGLSLGFVGVSQTVAIVAAVPGKALQKFLSGLHSMYGLSSLLAPLLVNVLFLKLNSWRGSFFVAGLLALGLLVLSFFLSLPTGPSTSASGSVDQGRPIVIFEKSYFGLILSAYVALEILVSSRIAVFSESAFGYSFKNSNYLVSLFFVFLFAGRLVFAFYQPPFRLKTQSLVSLAGALISLVLGVYVNPFFMSLTGLFMAPFFPLLMTCAAQLFPQHLGEVSSFCVALSGVTVVIVHLLFGILTDHYGIQFAFILGLIFGLLAWLLIWFYEFFNQRAFP